MKKRILCMLLALVLAVSLLPVGALAADGGEGESPASATVDPAILGTLKLSGCHDAQVKYLKLFACGSDGEKTGEDRLAGQTPADGAYAPLSLPAGDW